MKIHKYKQAMRWFTRQKIDPSIRQLATSDFHQGGRVGMKPGGIVEPGVTHYAKTDIGVAGGKASAAKATLKGLKPHEVTAFRRLVEKSAKNRGREGPNWDKHPGRGYASNTPGNDMAKDIKRRLVGSRKTDIKKIGVGSGVQVEGKILSKADQDKIKKRFGSQYDGEWNFKTKKNPGGTTYGISDTTPGGKNYDLGVKVRNFIRGQHGPNFAFDHFDSANYHLTQMHRAANAKVKNKNYRPIYSTKGIIGYTDLTEKGGGKEYYHADYTGLDSKGKKALLINKNHPDAAEINKLIEIVEGTKQDRTILDSLFKKHGYKTPTFERLLDSLMETDGAKYIDSAIHKHHQYGVGREPGAIQLVTRDQNMFAKLIERRVDAGKMTAETADRLLKPMGVQIVRDGKKIGAPDIKPEKQIKDWKKWVSRKAKTNPITFLKEAGFKIDKCLKLSKGGSPDQCIRGVIQETAEEAKKGNKAAQKIFKKSTGMATKTIYPLIGWVDAPIELSFALPHLLMGDVEAAKRATTFGLTGWGKVDLDNVDNPEARKYLKHKRDTEDWINNWEKHYHYSEKLKNLPDNASDAYRKQTEDAVEKFAGNMKFIQENYEGYDRSGSENEDWAYNLEEMAGKKAAQTWIDTKVETDLDTQLDKTYGESEIMGVPIDLSPYKKEAKEKLRASPTDLESFIKTKGQDFWGDPEGWWFYRPLKQEEAEAHGVGDIYDDYYMGASEGKDIRDSYSSIPLDYASQLGALEAKETREGLKRARYNPLSEMYYNKGGRVYYDTYLPDPDNDDK